MRERESWGTGEGGHCVCARRGGGGLSVGSGVSLSFRPSVLLFDRLFCQSAKDCSSCLLN